jgi:hypothetical protein
VVQKFKFLKIIEVPKCSAIASKNHNMALRTVIAAALATVAVAQQGKHLVIGPEVNVRFFCLIAPSHKYLHKYKSIVLDQMH